MDAPWKEFKVRIRVQTDKTASNPLTGVFDYSYFIDPIIMQFIITKDLERLHNVLEMRDFLLEYNGSQVEVVHICRGRAKGDIEKVGKDLCTILSGYTIQYASRAIVVRDKSPNLSFERNLEPFLICWDTKQNCYWLCGPKPEVEKNYRSIQKQNVDLWLFPDETTLQVSEKDFEPLSPSVAPGIMRKWKGCRVTINANISGSVVSKCNLNLDPSVFVPIPLLQHAAERTKLQKNISSKQSKLMTSTVHMELTDVDKLVVAVLNSLIDYSSEFDTKSIRCAASDHEASNLRKLKSFRLISCIWEREPPVMWVTGPKEEVASSFESICLALWSENVNEEKPFSSIKQEKSTVSKSVATFNDEKVLEERSLSTSALAASEFKTKEGLSVKIYMADITNIPVDCIVNAANEHLMHGGGVALAIASAAGPEFDKESDDYVKKNGPISVGCCCVTSAGKLPYKYVIHTVGPAWGDYKYDEKDACLSDLQKAVEVTFQEAEKLGLSSIATTAISSGIFGVPRDKCCEQYYSAVTSFSKSKLHKSVTEIHFVDNDQSMISLIESTFEKLSGSKAKATKVYLPSLELKPNKIFSENQSESVKESSCNSVAFKVNDKTILRVITGDISDFTAEAIICPQDIKCKSKGHIIKAVLSKLSSMEEEFRELRPQDDITYRLGSIIPIKITTSSSPWKYVFNVVTPRLEKDTSMTLSDFERMLKQTISNVLKMSENLQLSSISVPLLGTGCDIEAASEETCTRCLVEVLKKWGTRLYYLSDISIVVQSDMLRNTVTRGVKSVGIRKYGPEIETHIQENNRRLGNPDKGNKLNEYNGTLKLNRKNIEIKPYEKCSTPNDAICCICLSKPTKPKTLAKCGHVYCKKCIKQQFQYRPVCPACGQIYGKITGDQPPGTMELKTHWKRLPGYEGGNGSILITYRFPDGYQDETHPNPGRKYKGITRIAYLPNIERGQIVAKLLNVAFTRKLVFTIGRSRTMSRDSAIVWNDIHHKTNPNGGPQNYGYPDKTYLNRVLEELASKGVTEECVTDPLEFQEYTECFKSK